MNDADLCQIVCPCCEALLTIDDAGDVSFEVAEPEELAENEFRGLGGLVSVDAVGGWRKDEYRYNQQGLVLDVPTSDAIAEKGEEKDRTSLPISDPDVEEAAQADLNKRNIRSKKTKTTD